MKKQFQAAIIFLVVVSAISCAGESKPATPKETFQTYTKAVKAKDITAMKLLLSAETIKMHEQEAAAQKVTLDDIVKRETLISEGQAVVKVRNEKIDGERATLEVENAFGSWETLPFVFENGQWKIDKKGYSDQLMRDIEEINRQTDEEIDRQRLDPTSSDPSLGTKNPADALSADN